jgi:DNA repair exonuclease SbcCD ATPase subunit
MEIISIEFRNFASYGNALQKLEFDKKDSHLYLVLGGNGFGKSTIANVIIFGLYGQVENINLPDLPNRINKNLWVRIKLRCGDREVLIERGLAPKLFKAEINGVPLDQAGKTNVQDYLETEVFEMPYNVFKNVIILSINDFKSFLTMTPKDKRSIIDKLFGFSVINDMLDKVKDERKLLRDDLTKIQGELDTIKNSITATTNKLTELEAASTIENKKKILELKESLIKLNDDHSKLSTAKEKLITEHDLNEAAIAKLTGKYNNKNIALVNAKKKLKLYENDTCPECCKKLDTDFDKVRKVEYETSIANIPNELTDINTQIGEIRKSANANRDKQNAIIGRISSLSTTMQNIKNELVKISNAVKNGDGEFTHLKSLIEDFKNKEVESSHGQSDMMGNEHFLSLLEEMLGDDGVKNMAVKTILPGLNATIAQMVSEMHLSFHIRFDDKFNCVVNHLGEDINPNTLSTGEKKKADFIVVIALIKLLKLRFPQLNILFLDEIFSSVDHDGVYSILKILSDVIKEYKLNTFVINHTVLPQEIFDKKIEIYKDNGFSKFTIENIR